MAKLPEATIKQVFSLQQQLLNCIDEATATEFTISENFGETGYTIEYFEQLQNAREKADTYYSRLFIALRQIYPAQPMAHRDNLNLLARFITEAEATIDAVEASITEIKRDFNLL
jgi:hypothetical protein